MLVAMFPFSALAQEAITVTNAAISFRTDIAGLDCMDADKIITISSDGIDFNDKHSSVIFATTSDGQNVYNKFVPGTEYEFNIFL